MRGNATGARKPRQASRAPMRLIAPKKPGNEEPRTENEQPLSFFILGSRFLISRFFAGLGRSKGTTPKQGY
jgi:hypothetical protein